MMGNGRTSVTDWEFREFIESYPNPLEKNISRMCEPPLLTYNDFSLGDWPNSIVASCLLTDDGEGYNWEIKQELFNKPHKTITTPNVVINIYPSGDNDVH